MRIALGIEYDGSFYRGWQRQAHAPSVQAELERALSIVADRPIEIFCAGRTDAGVHGTGQVIHFDCPLPRPEKAWLLGANAHLPDSISIRWAKQVPDEFHARFSAGYRRYRYLIQNAPCKPALLSRKVTWIKRPLDTDAMHRAAQAILGERDFSSLRSSECQSRTPWRNLMSVQVHRQHQLVVVEVQANAFLHHMVRNLVGSLLAIGYGFKPETWLLDVVQAQNRQLAGETAPADGLYLVEVGYPDHFQLPLNRPLGPFGLADLI